MWVETFSPAEVVGRGAISSHKRVPSHTCVQRLSQTVPPPGQAGWAEQTHLTPALSLGGMTAALAPRTRLSAVFAQATPDGSTR